MTLRLFGDTRSWPTVPRPSSPRARIMRSTRSMIRAAQTSASLRVEGGVVPAWLSWPMVTASYQTCACAPVTMPMCFSSRSRIGPLLDMQLEIGVGREGGGGLGAAIADAVQGGPHRYAVGVGQAVRLVEREHAGPDAGAHQRVAEPAAFLVGPVDQLERAPR